MTDHTDLIARLRADLDGATRGPWAAKYHDDGCEVVRLEGGFTTIADVPDYSDALFIAAARQLVPEAADALEALRAENERLRQALRYYADGYYVGDGDCNGYVMPQDLKGAGDTGEIARAALAR